MFRPVSWASCSRMCLVGFGVVAKAAFSVSSCLALIVVLGPRLLAPTVFVLLELPPVPLPGPSIPRPGLGQLSLLLASGPPGRSRWTSEMTLEQSESTDPGLVSRREQSRSCLIAGIGTGLPNRGDNKELKVLLPLELPFVFMPDKLVNPLEQLIWLYVEQFRVCSRFPSREEVTPCWFKPPRECPSELFK